MVACSRCTHGVHGSGRSTDKPLTHGQHASADWPRMDTARNGGRRHRPDGACIPGGALMTSLTPMPMLLFVAAGIACVVCAGILLLLLRTGWAWDIAVDIPNHRSLHVRPVPRVGGWGVIPAMLLAIALCAPSLAWIALGALLLAIMSQVDDRRGLPARVRFAAHLIVVAAAIAWSAVDIAWWLALLAVVALVWVVNLYNFMDGSDGLAGGMAVFGFGFYAVAALVLQPTLAVAAAAVAGAGFGFLIFNHHPAKIFLGDAGSIPLGFRLGRWASGVGNTASGRSASPRLSL